MRFWQDGWYWNQHFPRLYDIANKVASISASLSRQGAEDRTSCWILPMLSFLGKVYGELRSLDVFLSSFGV